MAVVGDMVTLDVEKPAVGGRMIARLEGQVVLVAGAIPGERVSATIERVGKGVLYAQTAAVELASSDRREPFTDPLCGGCLYAHVNYERQTALKAQVIADAFGRIGRIPLRSPVPVMASDESGYRMRARLHVRGERIGFFREGSHDVCDARATRQLLPDTCDLLDRLASALQSNDGARVRELEVSENIVASQRVIHIEADGAVSPHTWMVLGNLPRLTGLTTSPGHTVAGNPRVTDTLLVDGRSVTLQRHVLAFFQGNRHLLNALVSAVIAEIEPGATVIDLYAGVGLFSMAAAVARDARVIAVEGDRAAAEDLALNAAPLDDSVQAIHQPVETFTARRREPPAVLIVDPPRTGMSKEALLGAINLRAQKVVYVSCDVATLARDVRRFLDVGYSLERIKAFDLFPNTPHVEAVVTLARR